jgi:NhaA family Na+:H+ antiporter
MREHHRHDGEAVSAGEASLLHRLRHLFFRPVAAFRPRRAVQLAQLFVRTEASSGVVLLAAAVVAIVWINSPLDHLYEELWGTVIVVDVNLFRIEEDLQHWVNDALMTLFFFVVGLEIKREMVHGELASPRKALLPAAAALGGMLVPALIYTGFNAGGAGAHGWGIPMATDIAFALGVLSLLGRRIPFGVKIFLLALAIADDIGAILVIAVFYTSDLQLDSLGIAVLLFGGIVAMNRAGVRNINVYVVVGAFLWVAVLESGVHATIAGVALGLLAPATYFYSPAHFIESAQELLRRYREALVRGDVDERNGIVAQLEDLSGGTEAPLDRLERALHPWVSYGIVPVFALANAGVVLDADIISEAAGSPVSQGIAVGLVAGKLTGIFAFTWLLVRLGVSSLPSGATWPHIGGAALLAGIGFTVSLFITGLAFDDPVLQSDAKIGIFAGSLVAAAAGYMVLLLLTRQPGRSVSGERRDAGAEAVAG